MEAIPWWIWAIGGSVVGLVLLVILFFGAIIFGNLFGNIWREVMLTFRRDDKE